MHFGIDTAKLNGQGFELLVGLNQQVHVGDALWNADLKFIHENAIDDCLLMVFTQVKENAQIEKYYGLKTSEDCVMEVKA
ncbi:Glucose-specific phosphotransferase enzyme IIA component [Chlamydia trachomatis]|nr:Glucose-specific phosphotransferase enzyme IIA component [Chlamydia trachomatis]